MCFVVRIVIELLRRDVHMHTQLLSSGVRAISQTYGVNTFVDKSHIRLIHMLVASMAVSM